MRALFMLAVPAPLAELGVSQELKAALLKLAAALPDVHRGEQERVRQRFHLDATWWQQAQEAVPHLQTIHQAVWHDEQLYLTYRPIPALALEQLVDPYGLVAKAGVWYVVCARNGQVRVHRVSDLLDARLAGEPFGRPLDFHLLTFWQSWCIEQE